MNDPTVFRRDCFKPNCATLFNQRDSAHGIPRSVLIDVDAVEGPLVGAAGPAIVPETIVVDHGKIYVSDHLTSVCQQMGISIQPARLRTGRDKGPVERFFRTIREDLLQALPGYKGPDVHSRGLDPESEAFFYLDELESANPGPYRLALAARNDLCDRFWRHAQSAQAESERMFANFVAVPMICCPLPPTARRPYRAVY